MLSVIHFPKGAEENKAKRVFAFGDSQVDEWEISCSSNHCGKMHREDSIAERGMRDGTTIVRHTHLLGTLLNRVMQE